MMDIDASRRSPLDQLAVDYFTNRSGLPSIDFCRRVAGVGPSNEAVAQVAHRLGVAMSTVRQWREIGKRASGWSCR